MSTAIFGGTFNPPHKGHRRLLDAVLQAVDIDKVLVMPSKLPPHKSCAELVAETDRFNMCALAFGDSEKVTVSDFELRREGKSYSYYTVKAFVEKYGEKPYFIMGSDMLLSFHTWFKADELKNMCLPVCISRTPQDTAKAREYAAKMGSKAVFVECEPFEISSTEIRNMIKRGNFSKLSCYLDENVVKYILDNNLYQG